jgi:hypothetical protein
MMSTFRDEANRAARKDDARRHVDFFQFTDARNFCVKAPERMRNPHVDHPLR